MTPLQLGLLLVWGTLVGVDLVSLPQIMISRPLVAGTVAGLLAGDPVSGVTVGATLELFALEVLPVGAARYPDYGPASVAAAAAAAGGDVLRGVGLSVVVGLIVAYAGEYTILELRRRNSQVVRNRTVELATGDPRVIRAVHLQGVLRDSVRALLLTAAGLLLAGLARGWPPLSPRAGSLLDAVVIGAGMSTAVAGTLRTAGPSIGLKWFAVGIAAGLALLVLR